MLNVMNKVQLMTVSVTFIECQSHNGIEKTNYKLGIFSKRVSDLVQTL